MVGRFICVRARSRQRRYSPGALGGVFPPQTFHCVGVNPEHVGPTHSAYSHLRRSAKLTVVLIGIYNQPVWPVTEGIDEGAECGPVNVAVDDVSAIKGNRDAHRMSES